MNLTRALLLLIGLGFALPVRAIGTAPGFETPDPFVDQGDYNDGDPIDAQLSGLGTVAPYGSFDAPTVGFAAWEKFSAGSFEDFGPQYTGDSGALSASLSQSRETIGLSTSGSNPGLINVGGTDYYGRLTCGLDDSYEFTLTAMASIPIKSITLAIKHSNFFEVDPEDPDSWTQVAPFSATLGGMSSAAAVWSQPYGNFSDALALGTYARYYLYTWDVDLAAGEEFTIDFSSLPEQLGFGFSVDAIVLSVNAVPEPATLALFGAGAFALWVGTRRRKF